MKRFAFSTSSFVKASPILLIAFAFVLIKPAAAGTAKSADAQAAQKLSKPLQEQLTAAVVGEHIARGLATLTVTVGRLSDRILAEDIARSTPGVTAVRDDLDLIRLPISNKEVAQQLPDPIHYSRAETGFTSPNVKLTSKDGVVTATEDVNNDLEHAIVPSMIPSNEGVKRLDDQLHVEPRVDSAEDSRAKALAGELVEARVEFGVVHLLGSVPTQEKAAELANKVSKASGVIGVDSELSVKPSPVADLNLTSFINDDVHR